MAVQSNGPDRLHFKVVVIGDIGVGKSCLITRIVKDIFWPQYKATVGVDFSYKEISVNRRRIIFQIWDTAGAERFGNMLSVYYKGAVGFIVVYDATRPSTVDGAREWILTIEKYQALTNCVSILVGNKCDIQEYQSEVDCTERAIMLAEEYGMEHFKASAKTAYNVPNVFYALSRHILTTVMTVDLIVQCQLGNLNIVRELVEVKKENPNQSDVHGWTALLGACSNGHLDVVKYLIEKDCDVSVLQTSAVSGDQPPLHSFIISHHFSLVKYLMEMNIVDPTCTDIEGRTILHVSAKCKYLKFVEFIMENEYCDPNCVDLRKWTPLFYAIKEGGTSVVIYLLENGSNPKHKDVKGQNALLLAASELHFDIFKYLIEKYQMDPNCKDNDGNTPLLWACRNSLGFQFANYLLDNHRVDPDCADGESKTPLLLACMEGEFDFAKKLIEKHNVDFNSRDNCGRTALHWACTQNKQLFIKFLIEKHHAIYQCEDNEGWTPFMLACSCFSFETAMYLLSGNYVDPNERDKKGLTSLHWACRSKNIYFVQDLIENFRVVDPNSKDHDGRTPLHHACRCGSLEIAMYLIQEKHVDPNSKDNHGWTPLHWACRDEQIEVVNYLITEQGVDVNSTDDEGWTALHYACRLVYHEKVISALVERADVNASSPEGLKPLDLAKSPVMIRLLLTHGATPNYQQAEKCIPMNLLNTTTGLAIKILIVGNQGVGKSTLSKSLSFAATGLADRFLAHIVKVKGVETNTAGIIPSDVNNDIFGKVTIYDFAGHREYFAGHSAVIQNFMASSPSIILMLVDMSVSMCFRQSLQYWIEFVNIHAQEAIKPHVVIVGSHVDKCGSQKEIREKIQLMKTTVNSLNLDDFILKGIITLNCQFAESTSMSKLRSLISDSCKSLRSPEPITFSDHFLLVFLLDKFKDCPAVTVGAVEKTLHNISKKEVHWSFMKFHNLVDICLRLGQHGYVLFIRNEESPKDSWIVIDKAVVLSHVNGILFAPADVKHHRDLGSSTGIVSQSTLTSLFPNHDINLIICFLCHLDFCHEITDANIIVSLQDDNITVPNDKFFFFPELVNGDAPITALQPDAHFYYHSGWILQCMIPEQFFTPQFSQSLLLRLAFRFAFISHNKQHSLDSADPALRINCRIWRNGLSWLDRSDAKAVIEVKQNQQVFLLVYAVENIDLIRLQSAIIHEVVKLKEELCHKVLVNELIVFPEDIRSYPLDITSVTVVALGEIAHAIREGKHNAIVNADRLVGLNDLLHFEPYAYLCEPIIHQLFCDSSPKYFEEIEESFLRQLAEKTFKQLQEFTIILDISPLQLVSVDRHASQVEQMLQVFKLWMKRQKIKIHRSRWSLGALFDQFSVFAGRSPLSIAMSGPLSLGSPFRSHPEDMPNKTDSVYEFEGESCTTQTIFDLETLAYKTMLLCTTKLRLAVRNNLTDLSGQLLANDLISPEHDSELRNEMVTTDKRAARLVELLQWKIKQNVDNYHILIDIFSEENHSYRGVLADLKQTYDSLSNES